MYILGWLVVVVQELQLLQQYKILSLVRYKLQHLLNLVMNRLLGRFAPIFYLNCERVLFVYILKQRRNKFCGFLKKNSRIFKNLNSFTKLKTLKKHLFLFLSFINLPCGHVMSHKKFGLIGTAVLTFIGYKQTNRHPDRQAKFIYRCICT